MKIIKLGDVGGNKQQNRVHSIDGIMPTITANNTGGRRPGGLILVEKTKLTDEYIGKYAILKRGYAKGIIGIIEKNELGFGVSDYIHATKTGINTGIMFQEDIEMYGGRMENGNDNRPNSK